MIGVVLFCDAIFILVPPRSLRPSTRRKTVLKSVHNVCILEDEMNRFLDRVKYQTFAASVISLGFLCAVLSGTRLLRAQTGTPPAPLSDAALIADFRRVEVASVSDALEQLTGRR